MIQIDGSLGEGGGQVLRTALTLSVMTGKELRIANIRKNRSSPGLRPQHLQAVRAAADICGAAVKGDSLGSGEIHFDPQQIRSDRYHFTIPTAGSAPLVLQTVFLPLTRAEGTSRITVQGGTHVKWSPCYHYLVWQWLYYMKKIGYEGEVSLNKAGYYPQGGGEIQAAIQPVQGGNPLHVVERGELIQIRGLSALTNLPDHISRRMRDRVVSRLGGRYPLNDIRVKELQGHGQGAFILLLVEFEHSQACYFSLGERGKRAEVVADEVVDQVLRFLATDGCIDPYLGDQLLLPLSLINERSQFRVPEITAHLVTNAEVIQQFIPVRFEMDGDLGQPGMVTIIP
ncbi:MAG: RNA 3'-terminal phosphate cyclase [Anaerolineales bacterium]